MTWREPSNELYNCACEFLAAAEALRTAAVRPGSAPALAATLGCVETALEALTQAAAAMRAEAADQANCTSREFAELVDALSDGHQAAAAMRVRIGPLLAQLT